MLNEHIGHIDMTQVFNAIYPVGAIYMSVNSTSPEVLFGGTWVQIQDTFLLACGDTFANGTGGGVYKPYSKWYRRKFRSCSYA